MGKGSTPRQIRGITDEQWWEYGLICATNRTDRSADIRQHVIDVIERARANAEAEDAQ